MIKIIDLKDNRIIITPECLVIEPFKSIWEKDKTKDKLVAYNSIQYIWFYSAFKSPFFQHSNSDKHRLIVDHIIKDKTFKVTKEIEQGIQVFEEIHDTSTLKLFKAVQESVKKMEEFFNKAEYDEENITKIQKAIVDMPKMQEAIKKALDNCKQEESIGAKVRGGNTLGIFENQ